MPSNTVDVLIFALVGIPGATISLIFLLIGIVRRSVRFSTAGALVSVGFCYFASAYAVTFLFNNLNVQYNPFYQWLSFLVLAGGNSLSALAVWKRSNLLAAISIAPFSVAFLFLGGIAIRNLI